MTSIISEACAEYIDYLRQDNDPQMNKSADELERANLSNPSVSDKDLILEACSYYVDRLRADEDLQNNHVANELEKASTVLERS
jgi:hypothetical protein